MILPFLLPFSLVSSLSTTVVALQARAPANSPGRGTTPVAAAWYTGWHMADVPLSKVSWSKYTHLIYAFATTTPDVKTLGFDDSDAKVLPQFVAMAHQRNVTPMLSIGGATGSRYFSSHVKTARNRTAFVKSVTDMAQKYNLDGLDFDWEFPASKGIGCNDMDSNDTENYLAFFRELRNTTVGQNLVISAAVWTTPWIDETGHPSTDVSAFSEVLDFIAIMNYDVKSNPSIGAGPVAPLDDTCMPEAARNGSAKSAVTLWTTSGMPANKIVLGVASYGHTFVIPSSQPGGTGPITNTTLPMYPLYSNATRKGDKWDSDGGLDVCGVQVGPGGVIQYSSLIEEGYLNPDGSPKTGTHYRFDDCSQTPFVYNSSAQLYVSYDDPRSYASKGDYIHSAGLRGFAMWEAGGDYQDALLDSILNATRSGGTATPAQSKIPSSSSSANRIDTLLSCLGLMLGLFTLLEL